VFRDFESVQSTLAVLPTGTGKLLIGTEAMRRFKAQYTGEDRNAIMFVCHREELLHQAERTIKHHAKLDCEYELGNSHASEIFPADVLLASVQTLTSGRNGARRMHKFSPANYGLIVIDEVHHATASTYRAVLDWFRQGNPDIKVLGLTATPERSDEAALGQIFDSVAYDYSVHHAIRDGWLVPVQQQLIDIQGLDFSHVRTTAGELNGADLAAVMETEKNLYGVCDATRREIGDRKAIMFTVSVKQAELAANILNRYKSGMAVHASGKTPKEDRRRIMRDFADGKFQVLVNCNLVSEGFDVPDAELLIQARPTKSKLLYQQQLGRVMRPLPGCVDDCDDSPGHRRAAISQSAKPVATVMDFVGNAGRHKLIHAIDILGGKVSDKVRELAERKLKESGSPMQVDALVEEAEKMEREEEERQERARRAKLIAKATYTIRTIDPFDAFDIVAPPDRAYDRNKHLSEKQTALLFKQGLDPSRLSYTEGKTVLNELFDRWSKGLCSLKQAALLKRHGYETKEMSRQRASELITELKSNGWQRKDVQPI
jgi:superfamily II DNA or RNA helicase